MELKAEIRREYRELWRYWIIIRDDQSRGVIIEQAAAFTRRGAIRKARSMMRKIRINNDRQHESFTILEKSGQETK